MGCVREKVVSRRPRKIFPVLTLTVVDRALHVSLESTARDNVLNQSGTVPTSD